MARPKTLAETWRRDLLARIADTLLGRRKGLFDADDHADRIRLVKLQQHLTELAPSTRGRKMTPEERADWVALFRQWQRLLDTVPELTLEEIIDAYARERGLPGREKRSLKPRFYRTPRGGPW
jgi:hypothetical protein